MRWFAAEFLVVVTGVLVALAFNAWWQGRQDVVREKAYLLQLAAELHETRRVAAELDSLQNIRVRANSALVLAYRTPTIPPSDSLLAWLDLTLYLAGSVRPVLGTAEALIATGDLRLIRNESLRSAVASYIEQSRNLISMQQTYFEFWLAHRADVTARVDEIELIVTGPERDSLRADHPLRALISGPDRHPFPLEWDRILADRALYNSLNRLLEGVSTLQGIWQIMTIQAHDLSEIVDAEIRNR